MKTAFGVFATLVCLAHAPAGAQSAFDCAQTMSQADTLAAALERDARLYWSYRATYVGLTSNVVKAKNPNAPQLAEQAKSFAAPVHARAPLAYRNLRALLDTAKKQGCATSKKLAALRETAFKASQRVRFDRFPEQEREEKPEGALKPKLLPTPKAR